MTNITSSRDYTRFKNIAGNRGINKAHVRAMVDTLAQRPHLIALNPILVNKDYGVIDGQHRLEAIKELGKPVFYIKADGLTMDDIHSLNAASKNWTPVDYAKSYALLGNQNYQDYLDFKGEFGLNHDILLDYLTLGASMTSKMFKNGEFKMADKDKVRKLCTELGEVGKYYDGYTKRSFAFAFHKLWNLTNYDQKRMLHKLLTNKKQIPDYSVPSQYLGELLRLYNHGLEYNQQLVFPL